ncbi:MAG: MmgE/PrpD family protein [SAR202 cluster bacterium]|jgi:2-methylcitrate dehydratase PrpD|nr:MmgE/PrpD family protein [Dehalococcoidia bacterium]MQF89113.1 MmgE/PrpD family protein [SAR202 cluster bacterium]
MPAYLDRLSRFVCDTHLGNLESSTVNAAKAVVLDTIGAMLAGSRLPENAKLAQLVAKTGGQGLATLLGQSGSTSAVFAALSNATAGVALEMDEGNRLGGGHAAIHVVPAALAMAEERGANGKEFLESVIAGYEVTSRIGTGTKVKKAVHSHGTWGTIGSAVATAKLMGFDEAHTTLAVNMAASMSPANTWTPCIEGATIRNLYPGRSGFQGIMAAQLALCGFTGLEDGPSDIYNEILGESFDTEAVVQEMGVPGAYRIQHNYFKLHACCLYNHPVLDGVQSLLGRENFAADDVERIKVEAPALATIMTDPEPVNMLAAKFSLPYAVATAVVHNSTDITAFYPDRLQDPETLALSRRVDIIADPEMDLRRYDYPAAKVAISLKDGRTITEDVTAHHGDTENPASREELVGKFKFLVEDVLGEERAIRVVETVGHLDALGNIKELTRLLKA